jgi:hypothetical protein
LIFVFPVPQNKRTIQPTANELQTQHTSSYVSSDESSLVRGLLSRLCSSSDSDSTSHLHIRSSFLCLLVTTGEYPRNCTHLFIRLLWQKLRKKQGLLSFSMHFNSGADGRSKKRVRIQREARRTGTLKRSFSKKMTVTALLLLQAVLQAKLPAAFRAALPEVFPEETSPVFLLSQPDQSSLSSSAVSGSEKDCD